jgi:hypothetical protein
MATLNVKAVEAKLLQLGGNLAAAGRHFGVTRQSMWEFVQRRPKLRQVVLDIRESRIDEAESALDRAVQNGEGWAISLTLKTIGKGRGYIERTEVNIGEIDRLIEQELAALAARQSQTAGRPERNGEDDGHT